MSNTLQAAIQQFKYYKTIAESTFGQLSEEQLFWQYNEASNSIASIIKHMSGNMLSRWTDFLTSDGEKPWRDRDAEFGNGAADKAQLMQQWEQGRNCLLAALESLNEEDLTKIVYIRNQGHTVMEAIARQLAHYPYHVGQIVFLGKMIAGDSWQTLTIPKGNSRQYNDSKFAQPKSEESSAAEFLRKQSK
jgi:hypothetical protein